MNVPARIRTRSALAVFFAWTLWAAATSAASAQDAARPVAPYLAPDHWAYDALQRADAAGLLGYGFDGGGWAVDRVEALTLLRRAAARSHSGMHPMESLLAAQVRRLEMEMPDAAGRADGRLGGIAAAVALVGGYARSSGGVLVAMGGPPFIEEEPTLVPAEGSPLAGIDVALYAGTRWAARVHEAAPLSGGLLHDGESYLVGGWGGVEAWGGRRRLRLGPGTGTIILSGDASVTGAGIETGGFRLPGFGRRIGLLRARVALARTGENEPYPHPWLWVLRASVQPHERFTLGLNRSAMVADVDQRGTEFIEHLAYVLIGKHGEGDLNRADNQVASVEVTYRPPLGRLPLLTYLEWGLEDSAGSWRDVPGIVAGAYLGAVPGLPELGLGIEAASLATSCCGNPWWYRHRGFLGGWSEDRRPLGHPLGGDGREWAVRADAGAVRGAVQAEARLYRRERREENLFAPLRAGWSTGGAVDVSVLGSAGLVGVLRAEHERGTDWRRTEVGIRLSYRFR